MLILARTILIISFIIVLANFLVNKKKEGRNSQIIKLILLPIAFGVTYIPMVNQFMGTDRLLLLDAITIACAIAIVYSLVKLISIRLVKKDKDTDINRFIAILIVAIISYALTYVPAIFEITLAVYLPVCTYATIILLCGFNRWLLSTRLGQNMRTVGQSRTVANSAGIHVNKTRIIAMCLSTLLAAWGQIIYLQNLGTFSTYGAHTMVGQYAIAALLVGGASVQMANNKQAVLGVILFHTLFVVAPLSASNLFGSSLIGEYFRVFICYGVIAVALAMHAWKSVIKPAMAKENK